MKPIIKLENISYAYQANRPVLSNINLTINPGEDIALIGPNGSGKSTLGKIIIALLKPKSGQLYFNETLINDKNVHLIRAKTGIVFQNPDAQFVGATVADDIAFGLENKQIPHNQMDEIIKTYARKTGVDNLLDKTPDNLSGGQKQKVALAGILAMLPDLIVFDEALAMLDASSKKEINDLIDEIKRDHPNLTIIRITHDLDEAFNRSRVVVLSNGKIIADDKPINIFTNQEVLQIAKLDQPFIIKINQALKEIGLIDKENYNLHQLVEMLCK